MGPDLRGSFVPLLVYVGGSCQVQGSLTVVMDVDLNCNLVAILEKRQSVSLTPAELTGDVLIQIGDAGGRGQGSGVTSFVNGMGNIGGKLKHSDPKDRIFGILTMFRLWAAKEQNIQCVCV